MEGKVRVIIISEYLKAVFEQKLNKVLEIVDENDCEIRFIVNSDKGTTIEYIAMVLMSYPDWVMVMNGGKKDGRTKTRRKLGRS